VAQVPPQVDPSLAQAPEQQLPRQALLAHWAACVQAEPTGMGAHVPLVQIPLMHS
jgi:hypothetical protein